MTPRIGDLDRVPVALVFVVDNLELVPVAFGGCKDDDVFPVLCKKKDESLINRMKVFFGLVFCLTSRSTIFQ